MTHFIRRVLIMAFVLCMINLLASCVIQEVSQDFIEGKSVGMGEQISRQISDEEIMGKYITDFLKNGFSKYYTINNVAFKDWNIKKDNGKLEAIVLATMNSSISPAYITEVKEKTEAETEPKEKEILQNQYEILKSYYGKSDESNFIFKVTANLDGDKMDEKTISLYLEQDTENNKVIYIPAEDILPE